MKDPRRPSREAVARKDSMNLTKRDRQRLRQAVSKRIINLRVEASMHIVNDDNRRAGLAVREADAFRRLLEKLK